MALNPVGANFMVAAVPVVPQIRLACSSPFVLRSQGSRRAVAKKRQSGKRLPAIPQSTYFADTNKQWGGVGRASVPIPLFFFPTNS